MQQTQGLRGALGGRSECTFRVEAMTGHPSQVLEPLRRAIAAYTRRDNGIVGMYIGIASGRDAESAMRRRYDTYKFAEGINEMVAIYESSSQENVRIVESELEDFFKDTPGVLNRTGGGGGRDGEGPKFFLYVAMRRWG